MLTTSDLTTIIRLSCTRDALSLCSCNKTYRRISISDHSIADILRDNKMLYQATKNNPGDILVWIEGLNNEDLEGTIADLHIILNLADTDYFPEVWGLRHNLIVFKFTNKDNQCEIYIAQAKPYFCLGYGNSIDRVRGRLGTLKNISNATEQEIKIATQKLKVGTENATWYAISRQDLRQLMRRLRDTYDRRWVGVRLRVLKNILEVRGINKEPIHNFIKNGGILNMDHVLVIVDMYQDFKLVLFNAENYSIIQCQGNLWQTENLVAIIKRTMISSYSEMEVLKVLNRYRNFVIPIKDFII